MAEVVFEFVAEDVELLKLLVVERSSNFLVFPVVVIEVIQNEGQIEIIFVQRRQAETLLLVNST